VRPVIPQDQRDTLKTDNSIHYAETKANDDGKLVTATIWLAVVSGLQFIALFVQAYVFWRTLKQISRQAELMNDHKVHLGELATAAKANAEAAILSARTLENHRVHLEAMAIAARDNATAALLNAKALITSERPWLLISIQKKVPGQFVVEGFNAGRTPAQLIEGHCACRKHSIGCGFRGMAISIPK
jgi:hypothetical protein